MALSGTVGVKRSYDGHRQVERVVETRGYGVSADLCGGIRALRLARMVFCDGDETCCAVYLGRGGDEQPSHAGVTRGLAHVESPLYISVYIRVRSQV